MRVRVVLQSRLSSSRLPGKALLTLAGRPLVVLAAQRAANTGREVVVATSVEPEDDALADAVRAAGLPVHRGELHDTLHRFACATADLADDDLVVRLTGDNVGPDGAYVDELVERMLDADRDYVRVTTETVYGLGAEVFTARLLRAADATATAAYDREHVTPWIRRHTDDLTWVPPVDGAAGRVRCTVDTLLDFSIAARALATVADPRTASWRELLDAWVIAGGARPAPVPGGRWNPVGLGSWVCDGDTAVPDAATVARTLERAAVAGATHVRLAGVDGAETVSRVLAHGLSERMQIVVGLPAGLPDGADAALWEALARLRSTSVGIAVAQSPWDLIDQGEVLVRHRTHHRMRLLGCRVGDHDELAIALSDPRVGYLEVPAGLVDALTPAGIGDRLVAVPCPDTASAVQALGHPAVTSVILPAASPADVQLQEAALRHRSAARPPRVAVPIRR